MPRQLDIIEYLDYVRRDLKWKYTVREDQQTISVNCGKHISIYTRDMLAERLRERKSMYCLTCGERKRKIRPYIVSRFE